jgi:hypothetical protein
MADFGIQALKAENAMLIELLKKNGIDIPTANPSVNPSVTGEKQEGFMSIPGDAGDLEEAFEILSDEPGQWKGLILPEGDFVIPESVSGCVDFYSGPATITLPPGFSIIGAGGDKTVLTGQFTHFNGTDGYPPAYCKGVEGTEPVTYANIHLELNQLDFVVGPYSGCPVHFNNVTFSHKFICKGIPDAYVRVQHPCGEKGDPTATARFTNCKFTQTKRPEAGPVSKYAVHLKGNGTYAELVDCVLEGKSVSSKGVGIYLQGDSDEDLEKPFVDIKGASTDISKFDKYGIAIENGVVNMHLPRRPKVVHDNAAVDIYKDDTGKVSYLG